jgi:hypothetical protein
VKYCIFFFVGKELEFKQFSSQDATNEVQTVEVTTPGQFRFGIFNVYTGIYSIVQFFILCNF